jgi:hypothetical protein
MAPPRKPLTPETDAPPEPEPEASESASDEVEKQEVPTVTQALSLVMGDVQSISKRQRNEAQSYNFRGIDAVVNAVGPALREYGVVVVPIKTKYEAEHYKTSNNKHMKGVTLTVTFRFYGPAGDHIDATATGEASDAGDKAMPKAHSVAFRTMLLQALCIPTDEPDPDLEAHDRAAQPFEAATGGEPQARAPRSDRPAYNWPKDFPELVGRMETLLGVEEAREWMGQAVKVATGEHELSLREMPEQQKRQAWDVLTHVLRSLDDELKVDPNAFPPPSREEIAAEFAKHLDGQIIYGPAWALSGTEAEGGYPSKEVVLAESGDAPGVPGDPPSAPAEPEPADEEQQTLADEIAAEEAAAAAERDREQARDASGK